MQFAAVWRRKNISCLLTKRKTMLPKERDSESEIYCCGFENGLFYGQFEAETFRNDGWSEDLLSSV